jgi:catechol 2,3-dioxygenase
MPIPARVIDPPFNITRTSHVVLDADDLAASRRFYTEVIGLVVSQESDEALYLRGVEEACHHSLVLRRARGAPPACQRLGLRVFTEGDLEEAGRTLARLGCDVLAVEVAHQGRTLHITDPFGFRLELCAHMPVEPRHITQFRSQRGGSALRIDHFQLLTPRLNKALAFYMGLGFSLTEYIAKDDEHIRAVFLQRKGNPHDIVFFNGDGPRLHHIAYTAPDAQSLLRACDVAGEIGFGRQVERGPGRHGPGHAMFVYFRDPDGHRVELFTTHYQVIDLENEPIRWDPDDPAVAYPWGLPAQRRWYEQATPMAETPVWAASPPPNPMTLERFLAERP